MGQKLIKFHGKNIFPHKINLLILSHLGFNFELNFISTPHRRFFSDMKGGPNAPTDRSRRDVNYSLYSSELFVDAANN